MVLLLALLLTAGPVPNTDSSPQTAPLKTIVHERTSPVCTVLHEDVAPAVVEIRTNDLHFERAAALFLGVHTTSATDASIGLQMMNLETEERSIADSLIRAETLLGDERFQNAAQTDRSAAQMKAELSDLTKLQNDELNIISRVVETYANGLGSVATSHAPASREQLRMLEHPPTDPPQAQMNATDRLIYDRLHHLTAFDVASTNFGFAHLLARGQIQEQPVEGAAASSIMQIASTCR